jgi:alanine-glyoxylate transaminase/serine-glyoxylate transaminase/serine-pyruvate transaminase
MPGHPALLLVDGVSSIASMDFRFDEWGVDVAVTGSQKGFMLPAGLAIVGFSEKAMEATKTAKLPRTFFDVHDMRKGYENSAYPYTPTIGLINGLNTACQMILDEGLENVFARHHRIAEGVRRAVSAWGWSCARSRLTSIPTRSAPSARRLASMPPASSPMPPAPTAWPSASGSARSPARCSASAIWAA